MSVKSMWRAVGHCRLVQYINKQMMLNRRTFFVSCRLCFAGAAFLLVGWSCNRGHKFPEQWIYLTDQGVNIEALEVSLLVFPASLLTPSRIRLLMIVAACLINFCSPLCNFDVCNSVCNCSKLFSDECV